MVALVVCFGIHNFLPTKRHWLSLMKLKIFKEKDFCSQLVYNQPFYTLYLYCQINCTLNTGDTIKTEHFQGKIWFN